MKEICIHQIKDNIKTLKFLISFILIILMFIINGVLFPGKYQQKKKEYINLQEKNLSDLKEQATSLNNLVFSDHLLIKEPSKTEFIVEGKENYFPDAIRVNVRKIGIPEKMFFINERLIRSTSIDWLFIISVIIPFIIVVLTYDSVSGERENGLIKLVLSNSISKIEFVFGKILGISISIMIPIVVGSIFNLLIYTIIGGYINIDVLELIFIFLVFSFVFLLLFTTIGVFVSSYSKTSLKSLIILSLIWIVFTVITPVIVKLTIISVYKVPQISELKSNLQSIEYMRADLMAKYNGGERGRDGSVDNYKLERGTALAENEYWKLKQEVYDNYLLKRINQANVYYNSISISPVYLFQNCIEKLFNVGVKKNQELINYAKDYQEQMIDGYKKVDQKDILSPHLYFLQNYLSKESVEENQIQISSYKSSSKVDSLFDSMIPFCLLIIELIALLIISVVSFNRIKFV